MREELKMNKNFNQVYQFKIRLSGIRPPIWRRIQVPETYTFWDLHIAIQDAMGWEDYHLHEFEIVNPPTGLKVNIGIPCNTYRRDILSGWEQRIADYFLLLENPLADYVYDFGDNWEHKIRLEKILPKEEGIDYPICVKGKRVCPLEDCGGVFVYAIILEALKNLDTKKREEILERVGLDLEWIGEFDSEHFDVEEVNFRDPNTQVRVIS